MKRAAMFGLDARIALAIFGALSVISGAALYSAISNAKAVSLITDLNETGKAWEQYYLDTGVDLEVRHTDSSNRFFYSYNTRKLNEDPGVKGWAGPYLPYSLGTEWLDHPVYGNIHLEKASDKDWGELSVSTGEGHCKTASDACFIWACITQANNLTLALDIDKTVDDSDGATKGKFRWNGADLSHRYCLRYAPIKNPNS